MLNKIANVFMKAISFLGANGNVDIEAGATAVAETVSDTVMLVLGPICTILGAAGMIWAIVLGVQMARADSAEKREESKKRLISLIIGVVIMIALALFFFIGFKPMLEGFGLIDPAKKSDPSGAAGTVPAIKAVLSMVK